MKALHNWIVVLQAIAFFEIAAGLTVGPTILHSDEGFDVVLFHQTTDPVLKEQIHESNQRHAGEIMVVSHLLLGFGIASFGVSSLAAFLARRAWKRANVAIGIPAATS
jgi:hypothetical protein